MTATLRNMSTVGSDSSGLPAYVVARDQAFTNDRCFLCGITLNDSNRTDEHVFPQWLLRRCNLWNQKLVLLNRTEIPYSRVKIPCCFTCNNTHLSPIEKRVRQAFSAGPDAVRGLDPVDLFVWLSKIYYGLIFLELFLAADRSDPSAGNIMSPEWVERFKMHHMLMQVARGVVSWQPGNYPASVFVFECQVPSRVEQEFDYGDSLHFPFLSIRIGNVGVVASLQDWGSMKHAVDVPMFNAAATTPLHPMQWRQMHAMGVYMASLFDRTPSHITVQSDQHVNIVTLPIRGLSRKPLFRDFVVEDYADALSESLQQPVSEIYDGSRVIDMIGRDDSPTVFPFSADEHVRVTIHDSL